MSDSEKEILLLSTINRMGHDYVQNKSDKIQSDTQSAYYDNQSNQKTDFVDIMSLYASAVSWETVRQESSKDDRIISLIKLLDNGNIDDKKTWPVNLMDFYNYRTKLSSEGSIVFYNERVVIPTSLRGKILEILHSGHGGVSSMTARAQASVWWPGIQADIDKTRQGCHSCQVNTPTQPAAPPTPLSI